MELQQALAQISEIRSQIARTETFRGYRPLTVGTSGLLGILAAVVQSVVCPEPLADVDRYAKLWCGVAVLSLLVVGVEFFWTCYWNASQRMRRLTRMAVEQFLPCLVAGGLLTCIVSKSAPQMAWMLPGLWAMLFSLGIFASFRLLPSAVFWVGLYYLAAGGLCLVVGQGALALSPWLMGVTFGGGQLLAAGVLSASREDRP